MEGVLTIDLFAEDAGRPHWLNVEARCAVALEQLRLIELKALSILSKPRNIVAFDPQWATNNRGKFLHLRFAEVVAGIPRGNRRGLALPTREKWDLSDRGGGVTRQQIRDLLEDIETVRTVLVG